MSRATELAAEAAENTTFRFIDGSTIEAMNCVILWPDFSGRVDDYNNVKGANRSFNLVLNDRIVELLAALEKEHGAKFRIHQKPIYSENDITTKHIEQKYIRYINVKVHMDGEYPPIVTLFTERPVKRGVDENGNPVIEKVRSRVNLTKETIDCLDKIDMEQVDMHVRCYRSPRFEDKYTLYLSKLMVVQNPQMEFDGRYDDWENGPFDDEPKTSAVDIVDGEVNPATGE